MTAPVPNYAHKARFIQGHDGDSFWLAVDFGRLSSGVKLELPLYVRLYGIDAWELSQPLGKAARDFTNKVLSEAKSIVEQTIKPDGKALGEEKYGRFLAIVWVDDTPLTDLLRANGFEKVVASG
jgi:endonuclease YncB( thermonuclease family)